MLAAALAAAGSLRPLQPEQEAGSLAPLQSEQENRGGGLEAPHSPSSALHELEADARPAPVVALACRILGNDMPPLQELGQTRKSVAFALEHEAPPPTGIKRMWLLNRIVDAHEAEALRTLLSEYNETFAELPFNVSDLRTHLMEVSTATDNATTEPDDSPASLVDAALLWATNQNVARNWVLDAAAERGAEWALPLDGTLFFSRDAWSSTAHALAEAARAGQRGLKLPMARLQHPQESSFLHSETDLASLFQGNHTLLLAEPQLAVRLRNASGASDGAWRGVFNDDLEYGNGNKLSALESWCDNADGSDASFLETNFFFGSDATSSYTEELCRCGTDVENHDDEGHASVLQANETAAQCGWCVRQWFWPSAEMIGTVKSGGCNAKGTAYRTACDLRADSASEGDAVSCVLSSPSCRTTFRVQALQNLYARLAHLLPDVLAANGSQSIFESRLLRDEFGKSA